jgi:hypothetical protein
MAKRNGGIIGPDNVPSGMFGSAGGVWRLEDAFNYQKAGLWPTPLGYQIPNSLRFNSGSNDNLTRTPASATNRRTFTVSFWYKRSVLSTRQEVFSQYAALNNNEWIELAFNTDDTLFLSWYSAGVFTTNQLFRDVGAWYHIVLAVDTTQATDTNRIKLYVNGSQVTSFSSITYPAQNYDTGYNQASSYHIGDLSLNGNFDLDGYLAEYYSIDGQQLTPSSFGQTDSTTGIWTPIAYTGTYGTNGFYLKFSNSSSLGTDSSGNGNTFTVNNLTSVDQSIDTPTNNFCTLNFIQNGNGTTSTLTEGNLVAGTADNKGVAATIGVNRGKWFWEVKNSGTQTNQRFGISNRANEQDGDASPSQATASVRSYVALNGYKNYTASSDTSDSSFLGTNGTIFGFALDLDAGTLRRYVNGTLINTDTTLPSDNSVTFFPFTMVTYNFGNWNQAQFNFGSPMYAGNSYTDGNGFGNFSYAVPSGYYALCSKNLALYG